MLWGIFLCYHQPQTVDLALLLGTAEAGIDPGRIQTGMTQYVRQAAQILFRPVIETGKEMTEVVREYFCLSTRAASQSAFMAWRMLLRSMGAPLRVTNMLPLRSPRSPA